MFSCPEPRRLIGISDTFNDTILGGTFDHLHIAHKGLISLTLDITKRAHICIMSDEWLKFKRHSNNVEDFQTRYNNVKSFITRIKQMNKVIISQIDDPYSYALTGEYANVVDSIVISREKTVLERTIELNNKRAKLGLPPLKIISMPILSDLRGKPISSTRIRARDLVFPPSNHRFLVTEELREELKEPKGDFYKSISELPEPSNCVIAVGDIVTKTLAEAGYPVSISIIDMQSKREMLPHYFYYLEANRDRGLYYTPIVIPSINEQGSITYDSWFALQLALAQSYPVLIRVYGEEDLLGFPATILAPVGAYVIYGDPFRNGLVVIKVNEEVKKRAIKSLSKMIRVNH